MPKNYIIGLAKTTMKIEKIETRKNTVIILKNIKVAFFGSFCPKYLETYIPAHS